MLVGLGQHVDTVQRERLTAIWKPSTGKMPASTATSRLIDAGSFAFYDGEKFGLRPSYTLSVRRRGARQFDLKARQQSGVWSLSITTLNGGLLVKHGIPEILDTAGAVPRFKATCRGLLSCPPGRGARDFHAQHGQLLGQQVGATHGRRKRRRACPSCVYRAGGTTGSDHNPTLPNDSFEKFYSLFLVCLLPQSLALPSNTDETFEVDGLIFFHRNQTSF